MPWIMSPLQLQHSLCYGGSFRLRTTLVLEACRKDCLTHVCPVLQMVFPLVLNNKFSLFKNLNKDNIEITKKKKKSLLGNTNH